MESLPEDANAQSVQSPPEKRINPSRSEPSEETFGSWIYSTLFGKADRSSATENPPPKRESVALETKNDRDQSVYYDPVDADPHGYLVHAGYYIKHAALETTMLRIVQLGYYPQLEKVSVEGREMFRLLLGPFAFQSEAKQIQTDINNQLGLHTALIAPNQCPKARTLFAKNNKSSKMNQRLSSKNKRKKRR